MQKTAMMEPAKREGVQNFWEAYTEENVDLVALNHHVSMPVRQQYVSNNLDWSTSSTVGCLE
jgi:hypothetical protein